MLTIRGEFCRDCTEHVRTGDSRDESSRYAGRPPRARSASKAHSVARLKTWRPPVRVNRQRPWCGSVEFRSRYTAESRRMRLITSARSRKQRFFHRAHVHTVRSLRRVESCCALFERSRPMNSVSIVSIHAATQLSHNVGVSHHDITCPRMRSAL